MSDLLQSVSIVMDGVNSSDYIKFKESIIKAIILAKKGHGVGSGYTKKEYKMLLDMSEEHLEGLWMAINLIENYDLLKSLTD